MDVYGDKIKFCQHQSCWVDTATNSKNGVPTLWINGKCALDNMSMVAYFLSPKDEYIVQPPYLRREPIDDTVTTYTVLPGYVLNERYCRFYGKDYDVERKECVNNSWIYAAGFIVGDTLSKKMYSYQTEDVYHIKELDDGNKDDKDKLTTTSRPALTNWRPKDLLRCKRQAFDRGLHVYKSYDYDEDDTVFDDAVLFEPFNVQTNNTTTTTIATANSTITADDFIAGCKELFDDLDSTTDFANRYVSKLLEALGIAAEVVASVMIEYGITYLIGKKLVQEILTKQVKVLGRHLIRMISGSVLKFIGQETGKLIAKRIGYMIISQVLSQAVKIGVRLAMVASSGFNLVLTSIFVALTIADIVLTLTDKFEFSKEWSYSDVNHIVEEFDKRYYKTHGTYIREFNAAAFFESVSYDHNDDNDDDTLIQFQTEAAQMYLLSLKTNSNGTLIPRTYTTTTTATSSREVGRLIDLQIEDLVKKTNRDILLDTYNARFYDIMFCMENTLLFLSALFYLLSLVFFGSSHAIHIMATALYTCAVGFHSFAK
jgi:hypothetical protein